MKVLVTGGAGYIGSHMVLSLLDQNHEPVVIDYLSNGSKFLLPRNVDFYEVDVRDEIRVEEILNKYNFDTVVHFAADIVVPESIKTPDKYIENNTFGTFSLLKNCINVGVRKFIFSSTAAVYGSREEVKLLSEEDSKEPDNPYGVSKLLSEIILKEFSKAYDLDYVCLRYFNVAGADSLLRSGQIGNNSTHLIKIASEVAVGKRSKIFIYGNDYPTEDGTGVRDYIHVSDLVDAHVSSLKYLSDHEGGITLNCGYGKGYSVIDVLKVFEEIKGKPLKYEFADRREGDSASLIANNNLIKEKLNWVPKHNDLTKIIEDALNWEKKIINHEK